MQIKHLSHEHPLVLIDKQETFVEQNCSKCQENILGPIYSCQKCNYFMCKSCVGYPHQIHHFSHHHPLTLRDMKVGETKHCKGCFERVSKQAYNCSDCGFHLHKSCAELPNKIRHPSHPTHSLTLLNKHPIEDTFLCHHCKKTKPGFTLCCVQCNIYLDVHCAFSRIEVITDEVRRFYFSSQFVSSQGEFEILCHHHRLNHRSAYKCMQKCPACKLAIADYSSTYWCPKCVYTIHDKCALLPQTLEHPSHPNHSLTLLAESPYESLGDFWCNGCYRDIGGFTNHCSECKFDLDVQCASFMPNLKYEYHDHPLTLFEKTAHDFWCDACGTPCSKNFYRCIDCDFNVHVQCILLPISLKHGCHKDPLKLTKYSTAGDDTEVFYCHACEKERNPDLNVYCCIECDFISEIECVFPGVIPPSKQVSKRKIAEDLARERELSSAGQPEETSELEEEIEKLTTKLEALKWKLKGEPAEHVASAIAGDLAREHELSSSGQPGETSELEEEIETLTTKLEALKGKLKGEPAEHVASAILNLKKVILSEHSTYERETTRMEGALLTIKSIISSWIWIPNWRGTG